MLKMEFIKYIFISTICCLISINSFAEHCEQCPAPTSICSSQGFKVTRMSFDEPILGTKSWIYEICHSDQCPADDKKDLSHFDIQLPAIGTCISDTANVSITPFANVAKLTNCEVLTTSDPSCGNNPPLPSTEHVAKCDIVGNLGPNECVQVKLTIAGEMVFDGVSEIITKAGNECKSDCIAGPSCVECNGPPPPPEDDNCLTRSPGFWETHPHISNQFIPVTVCGVELSSVLAGTNTSVTEALCVAPGKHKQVPRALLQLIRQLTAAKLNLNATSQIPEGSCEGFIVNGVSISDLITNCEALCGESQKIISSSGCIDILSSFNGSQDTINITPPPFDNPGPADPSECKIAKKNQIAITP